MPLAGHLTPFGLSIPGLEQLLVHTFAQALLEPVRVLAQNQGGARGPASVSRYKEQFWRVEAEEKTGSERVLDPIVCKKKCCEEGNSDSVMHYHSATKPKPLRRADINIQRLQRHSR